MKRLFQMLAVMALALFSLVPMQANASSHRWVYLELGERIGITVPAIYHEQKNVFDAYRTDVVALATELAPNDATLAELLSYEQDAYKAAWYGFMPGSMTDDTSPFHLPTHGYLAATRAMLLHMSVQLQDPRAKALAKQVDTDLMMAGTMNLSGCAESATTFNTMQPVAPNWTLLAEHTPTKVALWMMVLLAFGLLAWLERFLTLRVMSAVFGTSRPTA